jgi:acyl carrier protein phosphodiesterase
MTLAGQQPAAARTRSWPRASRSRLRLPRERVADLSLESALWDWTNMKEKDRLAALCELNDWVDHVLVTRYGLGERVPADWRRDARALRSLVWLHEWEAVVADAAERERWEAALRQAAASW